MQLDANKIFFNDTLAAGAAQSTVIDLAKMMSSLNRKHIPNVDRNGNAQLFTVAVTSYGTDVLSSVLTAPITYLTRDAVKAWHDARVQMFKEAGVKMSDLGPYARHLRPFLDVNHENGTTTEEDSDTSGAGGFAGNTHFQGDEYTRTRIAVSTPMESTELSNSLQAGDSVDTYSLTLCGGSVLESTTADDPDESSTDVDQDSLVSAGMISSYQNSLRKKLVVATEGESIDDDNPLRQLMANSASSEEVLELQLDASQEARPWDLDGSAYSTLTMQTNHRATLGAPITEVFQVPCGLLQISQVNAHSASEILVTKFEVLAVEDM